jgi:hypothetical protein
MNVVKIPNNIPRLAWVILAIGLAVLCGGLTYSFIKGWSTVKVTKNVERAVETEMENEIEKYHALEAAPE